MTASDAAAAVTELSARLADSRAAQITARHHDREIATLTTTLDTTTAAAAAAVQTRLQIAVELGIDDLDVPAALARGRQRVGLDAAIERAAELVRTAAPDLDHEAFAAVIDSHSQDELDEITAASETREQDRRAQLDAIAEELGGLRRDLAHLQNTQPAATLHAIATGHTARAAQAAERYVVLRLQREILSRELATYERRHSSRLLTTAGELLERLTTGRYVAVRPSAHDDQRSLVVVRADDEEQTLDELSEGTADQLYLALRLAGIDQLQADRTSRGLVTVPVVLDDILVTFDDTRATSALGVLAELSTRWQIILLTHHDHLVDLARRIENDPPTITTLDAPAGLDAARAPGSIRAAGRPAEPVAGIPAPRGQSADPGRVRTWARENGLDVGDRGRIPAEILDAYRRAEPATSEIA